MKPNSGAVYDDVSKCVDEVINFVGKDITFAMPLALGKPVRFVNELYRRAKEDPSINLKIVTALPLEKPRGASELEKRLLKTMVEKLFAGVPDLDYMLDYREGTLPSNVENYEFFSKAGTYIGDPVAQQNHIASNYTHVVRDAFDFGVNVFGDLIGYRELNGKMMYSMGCNTDICVEGFKEAMKRRATGERFAIIGEANKNMPFMYGDAVVESSTFDVILRGPDFDYELFGAPKDPVSVADHWIGINASTLIRDGGTLQVGIGALGDAIVSGLILRNNHNAEYKEILDKAGITRRYDCLIKKWGDTGVFEKGLYGSSEMFVDAFMQLYKAKILKRKVFDSAPIMKLINAGHLSADNITTDVIDRLLEMKAVNPKLDLDDFRFLTEYGILKPGLKFHQDFIRDEDTEYSTDISDVQNRTKIRRLLGKELKNGKVILGAFFVGPKAFYKALNEMPEEERQLFGMSGVEKVNQLYEEEELRALQRKDGRFVNTGMVCTLLGAIASDQLEDGQVVSGVGGQYNFVSMGHALPDGRVVMLIKSTKGVGKTLRSNIVFSYGHCTIPKHMRDIIVTEYGIADVRGKPDKQVIAEILNITDSRFQQKLLAQAKKAGKIPGNYEIPAEYRNNTPEKLKALLGPYQKQGYFSAFPFGTDLSADDIELAGSLKVLKAHSAGFPSKVYRGLAMELFRSIPLKANHHLERLQLMKPSGTKEKIYQKMVVFALRNNGVFNN
ncbi:MAG: acetyl-CoA hydrolase/transferase C-terminal domain-containing protein [Ignavibacteriales bacterium]